MSMPTRHLLLGLALGAISATALSATGSGFVSTALADGFASGIDTSKLLHVDGRDYSVDYDDSVSTEPQKQVRIKKVEYGKVSYVDITTTSTGTYSSEAMLSPHVKYPGVEVNRVNTAAQATLFTWTGSNGWLGLPLAQGNSITYLNTAAGKIISSSSGLTCIFTKTATVC
ncbi:hypothetical protein PSQ90_12545 [Devosia rhodophyticola]|uniref:Uncharacterized protein n=1 Tax=Devosia rhodophyticola TaxID=3026423 RepID=A0ABY7YW76_9HYPH|nr:hypothetical protein [Devosia rhodophyticola]WDR05115.1 hypothetical protein PSQ90_12545 [Devosia rhodophyticola]